ncbi:MAG: molybdate ABC transporter permease subunit, partial [Acidimicrobiia bacterium]
MSDPTRRRGNPKPPVLLVALGIIGLAVFVIPLVGLLARIPWGNLPELVSSQIVIDALRLSVVTSLTATAISALLGVPLAWLLARIEFPGRSIVRALVMLPLVLPPVVGGAALLFAHGRRGQVGEPFNAATGQVLPFSTWGVV